MLRGRQAHDPDEDTPSWRPAEHQEGESDVEQDSLCRTAVDPVFMRLRGKQLELARGLAYVWLV